LLATALSFAFLNAVEVKPSALQHSHLLTLDRKAYGKKSGGRSGGGSFKKRSSPTRSRRSNSSSNSSSRSRRTRSSSNVSSGSVGGAGEALNKLTTPCLFGFFSWLLFKVLVSKNKGSQAVTATIQERDNDIVTISRLQVALIAPAENLQSNLSELSRNAETDSDKGLVKLLQESALMLLRHEDYWTHVASSSEVCSIAEAEEKFNRLQLQERSKFSDETLVNVDGELNARAKVNLSEENENAGLYIVVTLLLGSADDKPLFETVRSRGEVKAALETMAALRSDYLMTFYLLWTPQQKTEALTYDEMLAEYPYMMQL